MIEKKINRESVRWLVLEGTAIVLGILLAFWIDAWWDDRQRVDDERIILQSLLDDLKEKQAVLADSRRFNDAVLQSTIQLLRAANDPNLNLDEDSIDRLIQNTWWYNTDGQWDSAPMQSLAGGNLSIISNQKLLQRIAELQVTMSLIRNLFRNDENFHHNTYTPFLVANAYLPQLISKTKHVPGLPESSYQYPEIELSVAQDHSQLLRRKDFQNMLVAKMDRIIDILQNGYRDIDQQLDETILLLNEELTD
jgi:hypothetical protein